MSKSNKVLTPEYLNWHAKLTGLPSVLTDKIQFSLYKKYKKKLGINHGNSLVISSYRYIVRLNLHFLVLLVILWFLIRVEVLKSLLTIW